MDESLDESNSDLVLRCIEISDSLIFSSSAERSPSLTFKSVDTFSCFSASWVYSKVVLLGVSFLEHERRYGDHDYRVLSCLFYDFLLNCFF